VAIRVGHVIGAGEPHRARTVAFGALGFGFLCSCLFATCFILFNRQLAGFFTPDPATLTMAATLIIVAGFFQVFDGAQVMGAGALRGCKDVRIPTWIIFAAYWVVAIPIGATLGFGTDLDATGLWIGLAAGLAAAAIGLLVRFAWITGKILPKSGT
jgi:MATE family multidrug resistance protein